MLTFRFWSETPTRTSSRDTCYYETEEKVMSNSNHRVAGNIQIAKLGVPAVIFYGKDWYIIALDNR